MGAELVGPARRSLYFEDVEVGQSLPPLTMPITVSRIIMTASASRDFQPPHHDRDFCQQQAGMKDMFPGIYYYMGMIGRFVTDWAGPKAFMTCLDYQMREPLYPGDEMILTGKVTAMYAKDGKHFIDLAVVFSNQAGPTTPANVTLSIPSRDG